MTSPSQASIITNAASLSSSCMKSDKRWAESADPASDSGQRNREHAWVRVWGSIRWMLIENSASWSSEGMIHCLAVVFFPTLEKGQRWRWKESALRYCLGKGRIPLPHWFFLIFFEWLLGCFIIPETAAQRHASISISSSFLNVEFIKLAFSTFCPSHFPYLPLLLLYPASHQQAGPALWKDSRDNPEWKRRSINEWNPFCAAMFYRCFKPKMSCIRTLGLWSGVLSFSRIAFPATDAKDCRSKSHRQQTC